MLKKLQRLGQSLAPQHTIEGVESQTVVTQSGSQNSGAPYIVLARLRESTAVKPKSETQMSVQEMGEALEQLSEDSEESPSRLDLQGFRTLIQKALMLTLFVSVRRVQGLSTEKLDSLLLFDDWREEVAEEEKIVRNLLFKKAASQKSMTLTERAKRAKMLDGPVSRYLDKMKEIYKVVKDVEERKANGELVEYPDWADDIAAAKTAFLDVDDEEVDILNRQLLACKTCVLKPWFAIATLGPP